MENFELPVFERWEDLTLANNFIFCKVMEENPEICKELLEMLLNIKIEKLEQPNAEKSLKADYHSHGIRFDVYVKDGNGRSFDLEIQTTKKSDLAKRARYYHGLMDVDALQSGVAYDTLKDSFVIFLCLGDVFGYGLPVYTFRRTAKEDNSILMNDGTTTVFFDALNYDKMSSEKVRSFFKFLCGLDIKDNFTERLSALVERLKMNVQQRQDYMTWEQELKIQSKEIAEKIAPIMAKNMAKDMARDMAKDMAKDMAQNMANDLAQNMAKNMVKKARAEESKKNRIETAKNMFVNGISSELIADCTGLSLEQVLELQKELMARQ